MAGDDQINTGMIQEGFTEDGSDSEIMSYEGNKQIMTKVLTPGQSVKNVLKHFLQIQG